jgi:hypothetical protein
MFKNLKKQVRPWDYIIFLILLIVSFIPLAIFGYSQKQQLAAAADNNTKPIIYLNYAYLFLNLNENAATPSFYL